MKNFKVGLQLFSLRDCFQKDLEGTFKAVKEMGYDYAELAGFYGLEAAELKKLLDKYGITAISAHEGYDQLLKEPAKMIDAYKTLGLKYIAIPWNDPQKFKGHEEYDGIIDNIKKAGKILAENGFTYLYHNHHFEFNKFDGKFRLEWLFEDAEGLIMPEFDTCWVHYAGYDPAKYILKYENKVPVLHLKDFICKNLPDGPVFTDEETDQIKYPDLKESGFEFRPVGHGVQDTLAILESAEKIGTEYLIVEQDAFTDIEPLEAVRLSREYLKSLGL